MKIKLYTKTITAAVATLGVVGAAVADNHVTASEWVGIAISALGVIGVYAIPNGPETEG